MHRIEIDSEVYEELGRRARPFIDKEPNDVIRRLLDLASVEEPDEQENLLTLPHAAPSTRSSSGPRGRRTSESAPPRRTRKRAPKGSLLDERAYEIPILQALVEHEGRAAAREVVERVGELVDKDLTPMDRETLDTGGIRWQARVQFARLRMKEQGLLNPDSPRGVWEITQQGRERLQKHTSTAA